MDENSDGSESERTNSDISAGKSQNYYMTIKSPSRGREFDTTI